MATTQIKDGFDGGSDNQLKVNADGSINVNTSGGGGTSNVNITSVGSNPVTTTLPTTNPSIGTTGTTAPTSATEVGAVGTSGNLQPLLVDSSGKLLVDSTGTSTVTGTVTSDIAGLNVFQTSQYSIGTTAVQITPTPLTNRSSISMRVTTATNGVIFIGNSDSVTVTTGYPMYSGDTLQMDLTPANVIYAISNVAGNTLYALEIA